jgi:(R,R)-butanediol dehydrogenase/meso-butanediol dehydrogenase/diacetyl reductase
MKAAVIEDIKKIIIKEDYPKPSPDPNKAIVKVNYCGICGSDITNFKHKMYNFPLIMGHEITGVVKEIGKNITHAKVGDKVICVNVSLDISQGDLKGIGMFQDGGFAEYVKVPNISLFPIPENVSIKDAVMVETFALAIRAFKLSKIQQNENVIIIGGGNVGLAFLKALLIKKSPNYVVVVEPNEFLQKKSLELGATDAVGISRAKVKKVIKKLGPPSFIIDCVGNEQTISNAINFIKKGGTIVLMGIHKGSITFPLFMLNSKEVNLQGCLGHDREDIIEAIDLFAQGKVPAEKYISEVIPLEKIQNTFERFLETQNRDFIKILVKP